MSSLLGHIKTNQTPSDHHRPDLLSSHTRTHLPPTPTALTASYGDQERLVWEQLSGLVRDAAWLESYIVATMLLVKETMQVWQGGGGALGGGAWGEEDV